MNQDIALAVPAYPGSVAGTNEIEMVAELQLAILAKLTYDVGKDQRNATGHDWFIATALALRDRVIDRWMPTTRSAYKDNCKRVYYLSLEFLIGRLLFDTLGNLELTGVARQALAGLGVDLDKLRNIEPDAALGNGGLGRLAACYMESMATLGIAAYGYGIRYDHGLFKQSIQDGWQEEFPEDWLSFGNPWEFERPEVNYRIGFGGAVNSKTDEDGEISYEWIPGERVLAVAYDTPITGWRGRYVNTLRLWSARASDPFRLEAFNSGDHVGANADRMRIEAISRVLYPSDETPAGQELRLRQEYFFASASLQDLLRRHFEQFGKLGTLPDYASVQLNDTHPAIGVAELMRLLLDVHKVEWDEAWRITSQTFSYTNHTLLPEALESWPVPLLERMLPRHMQIIYLINALHLKSARERVADDATLASVSLIDEHSGRRVRMGHLAFLGSHKMNGVSALHSQLLKQTVFKNLDALYPGRIINKTNGITFRRWLYQANPSLTALLVEALGPGILDDAGKLEGLAPFADDAAFRDRFAAQRQHSKQALAKLIVDRLAIKVDPQALFDVQIKRVHEYKRQLLNILETIALYDAIRAQPTRDWVPRVKIFAGKAAASYHRAKLIIKLINDVARVINSDPTVRGMLKVVFLPNYNVSLAETIIPAADLSEQISTAGMEASGTGNMKLALNGALTIGTMDGANVEIHERVGDQNIFIFGMTADQVQKRRMQSAEEADPMSPVLAEVLEAVASGAFSPDDRGRYRDLTDAVTHHDYFMVGADFDAYFARQRDVATRWHDATAWWRSSVLNTAHMGWFSSDRAVREYATEIWHAPLGSQRATVPNP